MCFCTLRDLVNDLEALEALVATVDSADDLELVVQTPTDLKPNLAQRADNILYCTSKIKYCPNTKVPEVTTGGKWSPRDATNTHRINLFGAIQIVVFFLELGVAKTREMLASPRRDVGRPNRNSMVKVFVLSFFLVIWPRWHSVKEKNQNFRRFLISSLKLLGKSLYL